MKQILQNLKTGDTEISEIPAPRAGDSQLLVRTSRSLVSAGTERMLLDFGKANLVQKILQQPDKVRQTLDKVRMDGLLATLDAVRNKLDQPIAFGYCNGGRVIQVGGNVRGFSPGDRVVSNGRHAEVVSVTPNLCARVPDAVSDDHAVFTVLAAVGLQGIRLANPTMGECVVVTGLGLIGLLTVQMLRAQGCRVLGVDIDSQRVALARHFGADTVDLSRGEDLLASAATFSRGRGVDAVIITAATRSNQPVSLAAQMCRKRGRIVLVGVTGLELSRAEFYEKELSFQVSCSYGPGRYDPNYEEGGHDYPVGFVRWTEQRNFEAVLDLMAAGALDIAPLISHRFAFEDAQAAYDLLGGEEPSLGILLSYSTGAQSTESLMRRTVALRPSPAEPGRACVAVVGAGNYASGVLIPALKRAGATLHTVLSNGGVTAAHQARKFGFANVSTDVDAMLADRLVDTVVVATRHDSHAPLVLRALAAGKHVFAEKPLCLHLAELSEIEASLAARPTQRLMVGFNRRFSPLVVKVKALLDTVAEPKSFIVTVNAGAAPAGHWTLDKSVGGGRIVGEACHFVDLMRHLAGTSIAAHSAMALGPRGNSVRTSDRAALTLEFADGSMGTIHYLANGNKGFPKERIEVFCAGRVLQLDNFVKLSGWGWPGFSCMKLWRQDKGQRQCVQAFVDSVRSGEAAPIASEEVFEVSRVAIELEMSLQ